MHFGGEKKDAAAETGSQGEQRYFSLVLLYRLSLVPSISITLLWMVLCLAGGAGGDNQSRDYRQAGGWKLKYGRRRVVSCFLISQGAETCIAQKTTRLSYPCRELPAARATSNSAPSPLNREQNQLSSLPRPGCKDFAVVCRVKKM